MRPHGVLKPIAGHRSVILLNIRKIVTIARNCGNIWISRSDSSPTRRPRKRIRLNAYAARAPTNTAAAADRPAMSREFRNQRGNGVSASRRLKLSAEAPAGTRSVEESVPRGFTAADSTNTIGKSANATVATPTACRHQTRLMSTPPPAGGCGGS
jgi:hypothetical protein